jgi:hypothetical protein
MIKKIYLFFLLIIGVGISVIAGFFSISGLTTIFKGSEFSVLLMGTFLEIAKVNVSIYLHIFWKDISKLLLSYLLIALLILMMITSLGIYGYLSKSFFSSTDTSSIYTKVESMNVSLEIEKSKVKTARDEIDYLNNLPRDEKKSWHIYRIQKLSKDIDGYTTKIDSVNEKYITEKVKLNSIESEVGPLKYLAMIIYQDKSEDAIAKSVQIFIIFIVCVFDPLAILTILSAISGFEIVKEQEKKLKEINIHEKIIIKDQIIEEDIKIQEVNDTINVEINIPENSPIEKKELDSPQKEEIKHEIISKEQNEIVKESEIDEIEITEETENENNFIDKEPLTLITASFNEENENKDQEILKAFSLERKKKKKKNNVKDELQELSDDIFNDEEKVKEIIVKERPVIEINREQEFEDDIINSVISDIFSETIEKNQKDSLEKMYNQIPMIGGKFNDNV